VVFYRLGTFLRDRAGVVGILTGLLAMPLVMAVGISVDYAQMAQGNTTLQDAVDNAALAGATVFNTSTQASNAVAVATRYINKSPLPSTLTLGTPTVTTAQGVTNTGGKGNNVTVTVSATIVPPFLGFIRNSFTMTATATASNPYVTVQPAQPNAGQFSSSAYDWDAIYMYPVPMVNGKPDYATIPDPSTFYEIASNCNAQFNTVYTSKSLCNGNAGATIPSNQTLPSLTATQPIGFVLENMTGGVQGYGQNGYKAQQGHINWFYTALTSIGQSPSEKANYAYATNKMTTYPTSTTSSLPNCSIVVRQVSSLNDSSAVPVTPQCFSLTSTASGIAYAAPTCAQINGGFYRFWWNDMGGGSDDKDYNDAVFNVTCTVPSGGGGGGTQVVLVK
jgi:Flp pilus assembly protein TadG